MNERRPQLNFAFFLHGHLPWVIGHGRWPHGLEWLLEASLATYLPLVRLGRRLQERGLRGGITLSVSPILAEQIAHPVFAREFRAYLEERIRTSQEEAKRFDGRGERKLASLARHWCEHYESSMQFYFEELNEDLPAALRALAATETIELATCGATHGYFPLLGRDESIDLQVSLARHTHAAHFGAPPHGLWLPEAAYRPAGWWQSPSDGRRVLRPGIEEFLSRQDIHYFLVDASLLAGGKLVETYQDRLKKSRAPARKRVGVTNEAPLDTRRSYRAANSEGESSGVSFFVRDPTTATQVWSKDHGYPGDPEYLEFHKKSDGGGHRYWRVTGPETDLGDKDVYDPQKASERARTHAEHFANLVRSALRDAPDGAIVAAPFDAELFGHWWHEGIDWLEQVLDRLHETPASLGGGPHPTLLRDHEHRFPAEQVVRLPEGSWGQGGHHHVWLNPQVEWTWQKIHPAEEEVWSLVDRARLSTNASARRAATAALRQLLLLCASDWQFLMTTESASEYAAERVNEHAAHVRRFAALGRKALAGRTIDEEEWVFLQQVEERDNPFSDLARVVNLGEPPRAIAASDSRAARSSHPEESADHSPRSRSAIPGESSEGRPAKKKKILRRSGSR